MSHRRNLCIFAAIVCQFYLPIPKVGFLEWSATIAVSKY